MTTKKSTWRWRAREWLFWEANRIGFSLPHLRYGRKFAPESDPSEVLPWLRQRFDADVARLVQELADGRAFILGEQPSIANFSLCAYMFWPEQADVTLPAALCAWRKRIAALPGWNHPYQIGTGDT